MVPEQPLTQAVPRQNVWAVSFGKTLFPFVVISLARRML